MSIEETIDNAVRDWETSPDAMRWTSEPAPDVPEPLPRVDIPGLPEGWMVENGQPHRYANNPTATDPTIEGDRYTFQFDNSDGRVSPDLPLWPIRFVSNSLELIESIRRASRPYRADREGYRETWRP